MEVIEKFPEFKVMYETLYRMCLNVERVMEMFFSEELRILDRNTVQYMIEEQQKEIEEQKKTLCGQQKEIEEQKIVIDNQQKEAQRLEDENARLRKELEALRKQQ